MKKKYISPRIETIKLKLNHLMLVNGSNTPDKVRSLDTKAVSGEEQKDDNTLTGNDVFL